MLTEEKEVLFKDIQNIKPFKILGREYTVSINTSSEDKNLVDLSGYCRSLLPEIVIVDLDNDPAYARCTEEEKVLAFKEILRHEIVHAYFNESGLQVSSFCFSGPWARNEEMIDWLAIQSPKIIKTFEEVGCL